MQKNIHRLQGLVWGSVLPSMMYSWAHGRALAIEPLFVGWMFVFLSLSYLDKGRGDSYSLVAGVGGQALFTGASEADNYLSVKLTLIAIFLKTAIDLTLHGKRASALATEALAECMEDVQGAFSDFFSNQVRIRDRLEDLGNSLAQVRAMEQEAAMEPRFWRRPWPSKLFERVDRHLAHLRICVLNLETALLGHAGQPEVQDLFAPVLALPAFAGVRGTLLLSLRDTMDVLLAATSHETEDLPPFVADLQLRDSADRLASLPELVDAINGSDTTALAAGDSHSVEHDVVARLNSTMFVFDEVLLILSRVRQDVIRSF